MAFEMCTLCGGPSWESGGVCVRCSAALPHVESSGSILTSQLGADEALVGQLVGAYKVEETLGRGGMGVVYRAADTVLGGEVALKLLSVKHALDVRARARFQRAATAAGALFHANIAAVRDAGEHEGRPYLVMTLYEGETLRERLRRGPLS